MTVGDDSFTTTRFEDLGSLDNIDKGSSCEEVHNTQGRRHKGHETSGEDSGEGSLSHSSSERNSTGYVSSVPLSDTTDTDDTVIFCGESGISGMSVSGVGRSVSNEGSLSAGSRGADRGDNSGSLSVTPQNIGIPQSRVTSSTCEDTCHDGGTGVSYVTPSPSSPIHQEAVSGFHLPQRQLATSERSQANLVTDSSCVGRTEDSPISPVICNGSPRYMSGDLQGSQPSRRRHPAQSSNGVLPQSKMVSLTAQGNSASTAGNHPSHVLARGQAHNLPGSPGGEITSSSIANSVDTSSAQLPQDAGIPANSSSSREPLSRERHYKV